MALATMMPPPIQVVISGTSLKTKKPSREAQSNCTKEIGCVTESSAKANLENCERNGTGVDARVFFGSAPEIQSLA